MPQTPDSTILKLYAIKNLLQKNVTDEGSIKTSVEILQTTEERARV